MLPLLGGEASQAAREGGVACLSALVAALDVAMVAYLFLLVVPLMARMSDPADAVRANAAEAFAACVALLPLAQVSLQMHTLIRPSETCLLKEAM